MAEEDSLTLTEFERHDLHSRLETYGVALEIGITWEVVKKRVQ